MTLKLMTYSLKSSLEGHLTMTVRRFYYRIPSMWLKFTPCASSNDFSQNSSGIFFFLHFFSRIYCFIVCQFAAGKLIKIYKILP